MGEDGSGDPLAKTPLVQRLWATCHDQSKSVSSRSPWVKDMCVSVLFLGEHDPGKKRYLRPSILSETRHKLAALL